MRLQPPGHCSQTARERRALLFAAVLPLWGSASAASKSHLPLAVSLLDAMAQACTAGEPLLVLVSLDGCPFCKTVREQFLIPLREQSQVAMVQVDMRSQTKLQTFAGDASNHDAQVRAWDVQIAPTVLFFKHNGVEAAPRLIGLGTPDYYGGRLEDRWLQARAATRVS
jgi:thioredoxin-related protein